MSKLEDIIDWLVGRSEMELKFMRIFCRVIFIKDFRLGMI
jgi:hypothetical protein